MKKIKLRSWVVTALSMWAGIDILLVVIALYMARILELGL